jgi:N-acyl-L-homoserine lactone synthetase
MEYLSSDHLDHEGRETDEFDKRSDHFAVVENVSATRGLARIVGSIRLIRKTSENDIFPIEEYFPKIFSDLLPVNTSEVSRFIARYPEDPNYQQHLVSLSLIRAATLHGINEEIENYYCVVEKPLLKLLEKIGIPLEVIGDSKEIPEQGGTLWPIKIRGKEVLESVERDDNGGISLKEFFVNEKSNNGLGYFDESLMGGRG